MHVLARTTPDLSFSDRKIGSNGAGHAFIKTALHALLESYRNSQLLDFHFS